VAQQHDAGRAAVRAAEDVIQQRQGYGPGSSGSEWHARHKGMLVFLLPPTLLLWTMKAMPPEIKS
jgi:hypothetical protein